MFIGTIVLCTSLDFQSCTVYNKLFETEQECFDTAALVLRDTLAMDPTIKPLFPSCVEIPADDPVLRRPNV